jgi:outer membrane murein-binding lipoprotein Lpp
MAKDSEGYSDSKIDCQESQLRSLQAKVEALEADLKDVAGLILTSSYTVDQYGNRIMDANEYIWVDAAAAILKKYPHRPKGSFF